MEQGRRWNWSIFDRYVGVFAALCTGLGAYYAYEAAQPSHASASAPPQSVSAMMAGAPWWSLALLGLSAILLVVSLTRRKQTADSVRIAFDGSELVALEDVKARIEAHAAGLKSSVESVWQELNSRQAAFEKIRNDLAMLDKKIGESVTSSMERDLQIREDSLNGFLQLSADAKALSDALEPVNTDLFHLLKFSVEETNVLFLDWLISESPYNRRQKIDEYSSILERERFRESMENYVSTILKRISDSRAGIEATDLMASAARGAELEVKSTPPEQRPLNIDPLDWRQYAIAEKQCGRLQVFLWQERQEAESRAMNERNMLMSRLGRHESK